jgi:prophage regulatory protein
MPKPTQAAKGRKQQIEAAMPELATARHATAIPSFDELPDSAFIREAQLVQSPKRPGSTAPLPFSAPTLWRKVKNGTFVKPVKLSDRVTAWKVGDVRAWLVAQAAL